MYRNRRYAFETKPVLAGAELSLIRGFRLLSAYTLRSGIKIWIITTLHLRAGGLLFLFDFKNGNHCTPESLAPNVVMVTCPTDGEVPLPASKRQCGWVLNCSPRKNRWGGTGCGVSSLMWGEPAPKGHSSSLTPCVPRVV